MPTSQWENLKTLSCQDTLRSALQLVTGLNCVCVCLCMCVIRRQVINAQAFVRKLLSVF